MKAKVATLKERIGELSAENRGLEEELARLRARLAAALEEARLSKERAEAAEEAARQAREAERRAAKQLMLLQRLQDANKAAALRQLGNILKRIMKGDLWFFMDNWRQNNREDTFDKMQRDLAKMFADSSKAAALRKLQNIMMRIMKGEVWFFMDNWRQNCKEDTLAKLQRQLAKMSKTAAIKQLQRIMMRIMKGEVWFFMDNWRQNCKEDTLSKVQDALKNMWADERKAAALRQLMKILMRIMKGEVWFFMTNWRSNTSDSKGQDWNAAMQLQDEMRDQIASMRAEMDAQRQLVEQQQAEITELKQVNDFLENKIARHVCFKLPVS